MTQVSRAYEESCREAVLEHGPRTLVACMVGGFYEFQGEQAAMASRIAGLSPTRDRGTVGFPINSLPHYCGRITDEGYVLVVMDQFPRRKKNGAVEQVRRVAAIHGPGNPMSLPEGCDSAACAVVFLEAGGYGYAVLQSNTGRTRAGQFGRDEAGSLVSACLADAPRHLLVVHADTPEGRRLLAAFHDRRSCTAAAAAGPKLTVSKAVDPVTLSEAHVRETLSRQFALGDRTDVRLGLEAPLAKRAFAHLVHFVYRNDGGALSAMEPPEVLSPANHLEVATGGLRQLDVDRLAGCLPACCTAAGRRAFRERLCRPCRDPEEIRERIDRVGRFRGGFAEVRRVLSGVPDVQALHRKMQRPQDFAPASWPALVDALEAIASVAPGAAPSAAEARAVVGAMVDLSPGPRAREHAFAPGFDEDLDVLLAHLLQHGSELDALLAHLNACGGCIPGGDRHFRAEVAAKDCEVQVTTTQKRFDTARAELRRRAREFRLAGEVVAAASLKTRVAGNKAARVLQSDALDSALATIAELRRDVRARERAAHAEACARAFPALARQVAACTRELEDVDVACACAKAAAERGFVPPEILEGEPRLEAAELRHPIAEALDPSEAYVGNDVSLGASGMLVYGVNGSGKSCLMKSVGIAVLMAQAGMYVDATSLALAPFGKLFTRIWNNDDISRGLSSFGVEVSELREILLRGGPDSLVLGDEMCSGTENLSATAIVAAGVRRLTEARCSFVFATHHHGVARAVADLPSVRVQHLAVAERQEPVDNASGYRMGTVRYDRRLRDGSGDRHYGLDVCRALGMPQPFLEIAEAEFRRLTGADPDYAVPVKRSRYNSRVFMGSCQRCGEPARHTHHKTPQSVAKPRVKNARHNLERLCEACHESHHAQERAEKPAAAPPDIA